MRGAHRWWILPGVQPAEFESFDGTRIAWYDAGPRDAPAMVFCNGLGGNAVVWRALRAHFGAHYRTLLWDYRGLNRSGAARAPGGYGIAAHARDLATLLEVAKPASPILVGWSMGTQVILELHRTHPRTARAVVALHGTDAWPLRSAFDSAVTDLIAPAVFGVMRVVGDRLAGVAPMLSRTPLVPQGFVRLARGLGLMSADVDVEQFRDMSEEWLAMDFRVYAEIFEALGRHSARDLIPGITTPTLVIAGERDRLTPSHLARALAETLPDARLAIVPEATHFGPIEYPGAIIAAIEGFIAERLADPSRAPGA